MSPTSRSGSAHGGCALHPRKVAEFERVLRAAPKTPSDLSRHDGLLRRFPGSRQFRAGFRVSERGNAGRLRLNFEIGKRGRSDALRPTKRLVVALTPLSRMIPTTVMAGAGPDDWWRDAKSNLEAARILEDAGKANEAYFHAGQSVEFLLKAIFLKRNNYVSMPEDHRSARWHDLQACAEAARLKSDVNQRHTSKALKANWLTVRDWKSNARFPDLKVPKRELNDLFVAVCDDRDGVWQWLESIYLKS